MVVASIAAWWLVLAVAEVPTLEVAWDVERLEAAPGDTVSVTLHVSWDGDRTVYALRPPAPDQRAGFLLGPTTTTQRLGTGRTEWVFTYRLVPTEPGNPVVPPMTLRYRPKGSDAWEETVSQEIPLSIRESRQRPKRTVWVVAVFGSVSAGLAVSGYLYFTRRRRRQGHRAFDPLAEEALGRIAGLESTQDHAAFCQGVSEAVRSYLEQKLGIALRGKATTEALRELKGLLLPVQLESVRDVLEDCDRGRFGSIGDRETRSRILRNCRRTLTGESAHED